jgi:hypothetical protein
MHTFKRFHFESIWPKFEGFLQTVEEAWTCPWSNVDIFRELDYKLRNTAKALQRWSMKHVGSVRLQLAIAKELVLRFEVAQETRTLAAHELQLRRKAKASCLGLASLMRTIIHQRSRIVNIAEGDANTKKFHLQACHRKRKSFIDKVSAENNNILIQETEKADAFFSHFHELLGTSSPRAVHLDLEELGLPKLNPQGIDFCFSEEEIWKAIQEIHPDKAPGPDGFTGAFYRAAWPVIKQDLIRAFHALWSLDGRSLYLVNQAYMILLRKKR